MKRALFLVILLLAGEGAANNDCSSLSGSTGSVLLGNGPSVLDGRSVLTDGPSELPLTVCPSLPAASILDYDGEQACNGSSSTLETWENQGSLGSAIDVTQSNASNRPLCVDNDLNGLAVLKYDGSDSQGSEADVVTPEAQPLTLCAVFNLATDDQQTLVADDKDATGGRLWVVGNNITMRANTSNQITEAVTTSTWQAGCFVYNGASSAWDIAGSTGTVAATPGTGDISDITIGAKHDETNDLVVNGKIARVIAWGSDENESSIVTTLECIYGL